MYSICPTSYVCINVYFATFKVLDSRLENGNNMKNLIFSFFLLANTCNLVLTIFLATNSHCNFCHLALFSNK